MASDNCTSKGNIYKFNRGSFPQIYISKNYPSQEPDDTFNSLTLCFRPANTANTGGKFLNVTQYTVNEASTITGDIIEFHPPIENPYILKRDKVYIDIIESGNDIPFETFSGTISVNELYPVRQKVFTQLNANIELTNGRLTIPFYEYEMGSQYEVRIEKGAILKISGDNTDYNILGDSAFIQKVRVYDFEITSVNIFIEFENNTINGTVIIYGKNFKVFKPNVAIDGYSLEYRTTSFYFNLHFNKGNSLKNSTEEYDYEYNDTTITIKNVNFNDRAGELLLDLDIYRECVCTNPTPCTCYSVKSMQEDTEPALIHAGGRLEGFAIGTITCTSACYNPLMFEGQSCTIVSESYNKKVQYIGKDREDNDNIIEKCYTDCTLIDRDEGEEGEDLIEILKVINETSQKVCDTISKDDCTSDVGPCPCGTYKTSQTTISEFTYTVCEPCDSSCKTCRGSGAKMCISCEEPLKYYDESMCIDASGVSDWNDNTPTCTSNEIFSFKITGYLNEYKRGGDPISLNIIPNKELTTIDSILWQPIAMNPIPTNLIVVGTENTTMANLSYNYISKADTSKIIYMLATVNYSVNGSAFSVCRNVLAVNHTLNVQKAQMELKPSEYIVDEKGFNVYFTNWVSLYPTEFTATVDFINSTQSILIHNTTRGYYDELFEAGLFAIKSWTKSYESITATFEMKIESFRDIEVVEYNTTVKLTNEMTTEQFETDADGSAKKIVQTYLSDYASIFTDAIKLLTSYLVAENAKEFCENDDKCLNDGKCNNTNQCECESGYEGNYCKYTTEAVKNMGTIETAVSKYLTEGHLDIEFTNEQLSIVSLNAIKIAEIKGEDYTKVLTESLTQSLGSMTVENDEDFNTFSSILEAYTNIINNKTGDFTGSKVDDTIETMVLMHDTITTLIDSTYNALDSVLPNITDNKNYTISTNSFESLLIKEPVPSDNKNKLFVIGSNGATIDIPSSLFDQAIKNDTYYRIRIVEWKYNPYNYTTIGRTTNSSIISISLIDKDGKEIDLRNTSPITLRIPLLNTLRTNMEYKCVYYDPTVEAVLDGIFFLKLGNYVKIGNFDSTGCSLIDVEADHITCECTHLTDFAVSATLYIKPNRTNSDAIVISDDLIIDVFHFIILEMVQYNGFHCTNGFLLFLPCSSRYHLYY